MFQTKGPIQNCAISTLPPDMVNRANIGSVCNDDKEYMSIYDTLIMFVNDFNVVCKRVEQCSNASLRKLFNSSSCRISTGCHLHAAS